MKTRIALILTAGWFGSALAANASPGASTANASVAVVNRSQLGPPPWCLGSVDPATATQIRSALRIIADGTDSLHQSMRDSLAALPRTAPSDVVIVTDEQTCRKASRLLDTDFFTSPQGIAVHLTRVGTRYAIYAAGIQAGEFTHVVWVDSKWKIVASSAI